MAILAVFILLALIYMFRGTKKYVCFFMAFYPILPDYFAIELGGSLPLLKASRIILLFLFCVAILYRKGKVKSLKSVTKNSKIYKGLIIYFICRILANSYYLASVSAAINAEFTIIVEQFLLVWMLLQVIDTREEVIGCVNVLVISSAILSLISIIIVLTGTNYFYNLNTISRNVLMVSFVRMGIVRAEGTFGQPVYYSLYLALIVPLALYCWENSRKKIYGLILIIDILALLLTETRGTIAVFLVMAVFAFASMQKGTRSRVVLIGFAMVVGGLVVCMIFPNIFSQFYKIIQSVFIAFGSNNSSIEDFGENSTTGLASRMVQLSGIPWTLKQNFFFGLGAKCHMRGLLAYYKYGRWVYITTIDNGFVQYFAEEGFLGGVAMISLFSSLIINSFKSMRSENKRAGLNRTFFMCFVVYLGEMLSIVDVSTLFWVVITLFIAYNAYSTSELRERG